MRRWEHPKRYPLDLYLGPTIPLGLAGFGLVIMMITMLMMTMIKLAPVCGHSPHLKVPSREFHRDRRKPQTLKIIDMCLTELFSQSSYDIIPSSGKMRYKIQKRYDYCRN